MIRSNVRRHAVVSLIFAGLCGITACTLAQTQRVVADGQLFCAKATTAGPLVVAIADAAGAPVIVTGMAGATVAAICARIAAIPVVPPSDPADAPVVAVVLPTAK